MVSITFKKINPPNYFLTQSRYHSCRCGQKLSHFQINEPGNVFQGSWGFLTVLPELFELLSTRKVTNTLWGASAEPLWRDSLVTNCEKNLVTNQYRYWVYRKNQHRRRFCGVWQLNISLGNIARRRRENFGICDPFALVSTPETWFFFTETS